jgi:hypothetical protein
MAPLDLSGEQAPVLELQYHITSDYLADLLSRE